MVMGFLSKLFDPIIIIIIIIITIIITYNLLNTLILQNVQTVINFSLSNTY